MSFVNENLNKLQDSQLLINQWGLMERCKKLAVCIQKALKIIQYPNSYADESLSNGASTKISICSKYPLKIIQNNPIKMKASSKLNDASTKISSRYLFKISFEELLYPCNNPISDSDWQKLQIIFMLRSRKIVFQHNCKDCKEWQFPRINLLSVYF